MSDKLDFMNELAKQVEARKHGDTASISTIDNFVSKHEPLEAEEPDYDSFSFPSDEVYEDTDEEEEEEVYEPEPQVFHGPESFEQEERVRIDKPKRELSKPMIAGLGAIVALILFALWFFLLRASIVLPDFTGKSLSEVTSWASQYKIDSTALARNYEYSLEYGSDVVISQSPAPGSHIRKDTPITFTVSQGADPNELISFPDISSMTYSELSAWKDENKLTKTKITTENSTTVPEGEVISYDLKNVSEAEFTRSSTLTIRCSKGPAPAGQITVENFQNKSYNEAVAWATNKKVQIVKQEVNSDIVEAGYILSQIPASGTAMSEGDTLTVTVSKGKGVKIPNLVGYSAEQLEAWKSSKNNTVTIVTKSIYNEAPLGSVIGQSVSPGTTMDSGDVLQLTISMYMPILETNSQQWLGKDYLELRAWCDDVNFHGADIQAGEWGDDYQPTCSDTYPTPGQVIKYACYYGTSDLADGCGRPLNNYSRINYQRSTGACTVETPTQTPPAVSSFVLTDQDVASLNAIISFCNTNGISFKTCEDGSVTNVKVIVNGGSTYTSESGSFQTIVKATDSFEIRYNPSPAASSESSASASTEAVAEETTE